MDTHTEQLRPVNAKVNLRANSSPKPTSVNVYWNTATPDLLYVVYVYVTQQMYIVVTKGLNRLQTVNHLLLGSLNNKCVNPALEHRHLLCGPQLIRNTDTGIPGWLSGLAPAFRLERDPGGRGSIPASGSLHGACFSRCLCLCLSLCVSHVEINKIFKKKKYRHVGSLDLLNQKLYIFTKSSNDLQTLRVEKQWSRSEVNKISVRR